MLTQEDNDTLCRVGPGSVMGDLMRQYWLPFLYSWELEPDGVPLRVRLLGEDLIAFRTTSGGVGLIQNSCMHRGASLFFGRNEEDGLRCVYHGWKYDVSGQCVDMPNEPAESNFKGKIKAAAYACAERGGVVWTYMGPRQVDPPGLPDLEWALVPETQVHHEFKGVLANNYMQALEGDIDSSHIGFLHSKMFRESAQMLTRRDKAPRLEVLDTEWGTMYAARRDAGDGNAYWRSAQFVMPIHTFFPAAANGTVPGHIWVPIDDEHTLVFGLRWNPGQELPNREAAHLQEMAGMGPMRPERRGTFFSTWWPVADVDTDFLLDRDVQKGGHFTGLPITRIEDQAMTVSMGPILNRTREHLGTTDGMIIRTRQRLLKAARMLREQGAIPPTVDNPELCRVRSCSAIVPGDLNWRTALEDWHLARTNEILPGQEAAAVAARG